MPERDPQIHAKWEQKLAKAGLPTEADMLDEEENSLPLQKKDVIVKETPEDRLKLASEEVLAGFSELPPKFQKEIIADVKEYQTKGKNFTQVSNHAKRLVKQNSSKKRDYFSEKLDLIRSKKDKLASLEKRKETIAEIKSTLLRQQKGLGLFIKDIYDQIYQNSKISYDQLLKTRDDYSEKFRFSEEQLTQINTVLKIFWQRHLETETAREKYEQNPETLFQLRFGKPPKAKVEVVYGPMTVTFVLEHEDYNFARSGHESSERWERIKQSGGAAFEYRPGALPLTLNIVRKTQPKTSILHEDQHQFNKLFLPKENRQELSQEFLESVIEKESTQKARRQKIAYALAKNIRKQTVDTQARDEILAQLRSKKNTASIFETLLKNPLYKYFNSHTIEWNSIYIRNFFKNLQEDGKYDEEWVKGHQEIYLHIPPYKLSSKDWGRVRVPTQNEVETQTKLAYERYYDDLKKALEAVEELQKSGMENTEIIPLLYAFPMDRWNIFVRRFLKELSPTAPKPEPAEMAVNQPDISKEPTEIKQKKWYEKLRDYQSLWPKVWGKITKD